MIWQILKHEGFEGGEKIEYYKLPRRFKLLVTHSICHPFPISSLKSTKFVISHSLNGRGPLILYAINVLDVTFLTEKRMKLFNK